MLTAAQRDVFERDGLLLVSGLIEVDVARAGGDILVRAAAAEPEHERFADGSMHRRYAHPELLACFTRRALDTAAELTGAGTGAFDAPADAYTSTVFPTVAPWTGSSRHIDVFWEKGVPIFPRPYAIGLIIYLSDVTPGGGGTLVWPGSHRQLEAIARSDPQRYPSTETLNADVPGFSLGEPRELTPACGDVLFYHYLCVHAGSRNVGDQPRPALFMKW
jgi:ectoine hydroxylase-related dioxygenase (phytanoyl-CoA dioxygenase family)